MAGSQLWGHTKRGSTQQLRTTWQHSVTLVHRTLPRPERRKHWTASTLSSGGGDVKHTAEHVLDWLHLDTVAGRPPGEQQPIEFRLEADDTVLIRGCPRVRLSYAMRGPTIRPADLLEMGTKVQ
jgi:hypothetical protein